MLSGASTLCSPSNCASWSGGLNGFFLSLTLGALKFYKSPSQRSQKKFLLFCQSYTFCAFLYLFSFTLDKNNRYHRLNHILGIPSLLLDMAIDISALPCV